ncbi:hypothetical protein N018_21815 [Pseudomonas syringae CC1557]|uniref:Uncharacterized protein n=1 Tax=Pseudomonas syringae CC1557 TaxID=1357279 RepID=W0MZ09_PSESX|nr:hypothetical protein N018_21815 [Pseudomonas syringae CC1557]
MPSVQSHPVTANSQVQGGKTVLVGLHRNDQIAAFASADHVADIHVDAIQDAHNPDMSINEAGEQETLLNPGHYFQPEKS